MAIKSKNIGSEVLMVIGLSLMILNFYLYIEDPYEKNIKLSKLIMLMIAFTGIIFFTNQLYKYLSFGILMLLSIAIYFLA